MIRVRIAEREWRFPEGEWEARVSGGEVPPDALVFSLQLTGGLWRRAASLPLYDFFRRSGEEERREAALGDRGRPPFEELPRVLFPRRGLSATEALLAANLLVAGLLILLWKGSYTTRIWGVAWDFHEALLRHHQPLGLFATIFMHADLGHLGANMISLLPSAAFVEYLYGRWALGVYLIGGVAAALVSYGFKGHGPLSVGASGAVYALIGAFGGFVLRHLGRLPRWHRWKARRIYIPALLLVTLPSILHADWRAHVGGFAAGLLLGLLLPLHARGRELLLMKARS
jgi:membrane associated rhomboid family serine protease